MRTAGRVLAWVVVVVAGLATLLFVAIAIDNDGDSDLIFGGLMFAAIAVAVGLVAFFVQRALRKRRAARGEQGGSAGELLERAAHGETVELQPRRLKWALMFLGCLVFSVILVPAAFLAPSPLTIAGALLFGPGAILSAWSLLPGAAYLRISPEGLVAKVPVRTRRWAWNDVENFRVFEVRSRYSTQRFVGFDMRNRTHENQSFLETVNRGVSGVDAGLPDTYGVDPEELADTLGRLRERHATERGPSPSVLADRRLAEQTATIDQSRPVVVTWVLAIVCVGIYAWEASRYDLAPSASELVDLGGATDGAAWWTLLFANLLHADVLHIVLNLLAWAVLGFLLEREIGAARMALLAVLAGVASMGLAVTLQPDVVTVGLSGVVIAAVGWGVVRDVHRTRTLGVVAWSMLPFILVYTFLSPGTSIGGHLGGLGAGLLLGWYSART